MVRLFTFILSIFNLVFRGFVIKTFWAWFLLTQFPSLPTITTIGAIGLIYTISVLTPTKHYTEAELEDLKDPDGTVTLVNGVIQFLATLLCLGSGWVVHHFFF